MTLIVNNFGRRLRQIKISYSWIFIVFSFLYGHILAQKHGDLHENGGEYGKNHLRGIRPLNVQPRDFNRDEVHIIDSNERDGGKIALKRIETPTNDSKQDEQLVRVPIFAKIQRSPLPRPPIAIAPPNPFFIINESNEFLNTVTASSIATTIINANSNTKGILLPANETQTMFRPTNIQKSSKWRKIGPLIDARGSLFQRMRLINQNHVSSFGLSSAQSLATSNPSVEPISNTENISLKTKENSSFENYHIPTLVHVQSPAKHLATLKEQNNEKIIVSKTSLQSSEKITNNKNKVIKKITENNSKLALRNYGDVESMDVIVSKKNSTPNNLRRYRPKIRGQILASTIESEPNQAPKKIIEDEERNGLLGTNESSDAPTIFENDVPLSFVSSSSFSDASNDDYHHRKGMALEKRFKLTPAKVSYRPRLKIRRPSDNFALAARAAASGGNFNAQAPIQLPHLAPLHQKANAPQSSSTTRGGRYFSGGGAARQFSRKAFIIEEPTSSSNADREVVIPVRGLGDNVAIVSPAASRAAARAAAAPTNTRDKDDAIETDQFTISKEVHLSSPTLPSFVTTAINRPEESLQISVNEFLNSTLIPVFPTDGENRGSVGEQPPQPSPHKSFLEIPALFPGLQGYEENTNNDSGVKIDNGLVFASPGHVPSKVNAEAFAAVFPDNFSADGQELNSLHRERIKPERNDAVTTRLAIISNITPTIPVVIEPEEPFNIPENSGLRPVAPPSELTGAGFGSSPRRGLRKGSGDGFEGASGIQPSGNKNSHVSANVQVEPPALKEDDFFTGESALTPNRRGPNGDGYGPPVLEGAAVPPLPPPGAPVTYGGAAAGIVPQSLLSIPESTGPVESSGAQFLSETEDNQATTVRPSALLSILNRADEGFNQVISHFEQGTPIEAAAIDVLEVALGSQKLDSQAKLLSHVDRTIGLDNIQRLQRWANTGGALDMLKEQFAKIAKNYKPPPETRAITIPPQFEYLFQPGSGR